jgi:hypothetical protein
MKMTYQKMKLKLVLQAIQAIQAIQTSVASK